MQLTQKDLILLAVEGLNARDRFNNEIREALADMFNAEIEKEKAVKAVSETKSTTKKEKVSDKK